MRVEAVSVTNYRGIREATLNGLGGEPVLTVSGRNGSGKSLLLEAIVLAWRASAVDPISMVGPWGIEASVNIHLAFTVDERAQIADFANRHGMDIPEGNVPEVVRLGLTLSRSHGWSYTDEPSGHILRNGAFRKDNAFASIDYLPAERMMGRGEQAVVNIALMSEQEIEQLRQHVDQTYQYRQAFHLSGVTSYIATLDYLELVSDRQQLDIQRDFELISDVFFEATGKRIERPRVTSSLQTELNVSTPADIAHSLDLLSSGEQEVLGLMYFIRRLSAGGGVLLVDEPELHLHPALQRSLFSVMQSTSQRAQVWVVTHSPKLVASAALSGTVHMTPPEREPANQARLAEREEMRMDLLDDLGLNVVDLLQSDQMLVLEGESDAALLSQLLPVEMGRSAVAVAGSAQDVLSTCRTLSAAGSPIPWLGIRDRDLLTDDEVSELMGEGTHLFIWPNRSVEAEFLYPPLAARGLQRMGINISAGEVEAALSRLAAGHMPHVVARLTEYRLTLRPTADAPRGTTPVETLRSELDSLRQHTQDKLRDFDEVSQSVAEELHERWPHEWFRLADAKRLLGEFVGEMRAGPRSRFTKAVGFASVEEGIRPPGIDSLVSVLAARHERHQP